MGESHETSSEHGQIIKNYKIRRKYILNIEKNILHEVNNYVLFDLRINIFLYYYWYINDLFTQCLLQ